MCFFASSGVHRIRPHQSQQKYSLDVKIFTPTFALWHLTPGETINDSSAALHLRYLQVDIPKSARALTDSNVPHSWSCSEYMNSTFSSFRLWTASAPRRTRQWSSPSPSTWWTACWAARPTRRSSRWRRRTPPRRDMLDMDRDKLDGLKTTRCWRWKQRRRHKRVASELWLLKLFGDRNSKSLINLVGKCISTSWIYWPKAQRQRQVVDLSSST